MDVLIQSYFLGIIGSWIALYCLGYHLTDGRALRLHLIFTLIWPISWLLVVYIALVHGRHAR